MENTNSKSKIKRLALCLISALLVLSAGTIQTSCSIKNSDNANTSSSYEYVNNELSFSLQFPIMPEETKEAQEIKGKVYTTLHLHSERDIAFTNINVLYLEPYTDEELAVFSEISDEDLNNKLSESLIGTFHFITGDKGLDPDVEYAKSNGNRVVRTVFSTTYNEQEIWLYGFEMIRYDGRLFSCTGARQTKDEATAALTSFTLLTPETDNAESESNLELSAPAAPQIPSGAIDWTEANQHIGETVTIYGAVVSSTYANTSNGQPTYINIGVDYPDISRVSVVVWGEDRASFSGAPEDMYLNKTICVTGEIYVYDGACNIKVKSPAQIRVLE